MATTNISICNSALILVGADEINSFSDATAEAKLANSVYTDTKQTLLQYHPWRFSLKQKDLGGALVTTPTFDWKYQHQLPSDLLRVIHLYGNDDYQIFGDKIYTNNSTCKMVYQADVLESEMPSYFIKAFQFQLARLFSMSLQEDINKMQAFDQAADKEMMRAKNIDSQQQPNQKIPDTNYSMLNIRG